MSVFHSEVPAERLRRRIEVYNAYALLQFLSRASPSHDTSQFRSQSQFQFYCHGFSFIISLEQDLIHHHNFIDVKKDILARDSRKKKRFL